MNQPPNNRKSLREYIAGLSVWGKIFWVIVLGYIVGRIVLWVRYIL